jgi:uncharacterized protein
MSQQKTTLVIGASTNIERYSYKAIISLTYHKYSVIAFGLRKGEVNDIEIETVWNPKWEVDTVTLYINPSLQKEYYDKIIDLKPKRVIFNPGTENYEFQQLLSHKGIEFENACTLVLLSIGDY